MIEENGVGIFGRNFDFWTVLPKQLMVYEILPLKVQCQGAPKQFKDGQNLSIILTTSRQSKAYYLTKCSVDDTKPDKQMAIISETSQISGFVLDNAASALWAANIILRALPNLRCTL